MVSSDACFYKSYTIVMLHSNLHNPQVKDKMKLEEFINLCKSVEGITQ